MARRPSVDRPSYRTTATTPAPSEQRRTLRTIVDMVGAWPPASAFVLWHLQPDLLLRDTTPAGGDMGAHVWGPAYLRDHLLPHGQVAGWTGDWYAGFPAYQFYMVVPSLLIVVLNAGIHGAAALVPAVGGHRGARRRRRRAGTTGGVRTLAHRWRPVVALRAGRACRTAWPSSW